MVEPITEFIEVTLQISVIKAMIHAFNICLDMKQRYGLSNMLSWLKEREPKGHCQYDFVSPTLDNVYKCEVEAKGMGDYLVAYIQKD